MDIPQPAISAAVGRPEQPSATALLARLPVPAFAGLVFALVAAAVLASVLRATGGVLVYALDDPYIHLALAEQLVHGHYGINPGEVSSPSSSVIWPFLLMPLAGTALHAWLPLALTFTFGLATALLLGRFMADLPVALPERLAHVARLALAGVLVLATNTVGLAFTGLEHNLQVLLAVAAALGVVEAWGGRPIPVWTIGAAALGPAVRYEMLAVTAAVAICLMAQRRWSAMLAMCAASVALPALLAAFLIANGNMPLPNSVLFKLSGEAGKSVTILERLLPLQNPILEYKPIMVMRVVLVVLLGMAWRMRGAQRWVALAAVAAAGLHTMVGQYGWYYRYEVYAVAFCGLVAFAASVSVWPRAALAVAATALVLTSTAYTMPLLRAPGAARNIFDQQYQMARFVHEFHKGNVAVNDLGLVSFARDPSIEVLDLLGLASNEALRQRHKTAAWLDDITRRHGAGLAIIYREAFTDIPASWTPVGQMWLSSARITPAIDRVVFYATAVGDASMIRRELEAFRPTLPMGVRLDLAQ